MELALQGLSGIEVATGGATGVSKIEVYPGPLHLGAIRATYESKATLEFKADHWGAASQQAAFEKQLKKSLVSKLGVPESAIKFNPAGTIAGTVLTNTVEITSPNKVSDDLQSSWQTNVLAAVADAKATWKAENPSLRSAAPANTFTMTVRLPVDIKNEASGIALDFVIQGIDYNAVPEGNKAVFAADLIAQIQTGVYGTMSAAARPALATDLDVTISPGDTPASLDVTAKIPLQPANINTAMVEMVKDSRATAGMPGNLYHDVKLRLTPANLPGLKYFASWTPGSVKVTAPGVKVTKA